MISTVMSEQPIGTCVIVLDKTQTKLLLGKRINAYKAGFYGLPGGRIDHAEQLETGARRELQEETGLKTHELEYIGVVREKQEAYSFIHFAFVCKKYKGTPKTLEPEKCEKWEWFSFNEFPKKILPGHKAAIELFMAKDHSTIKDLL